KLCFYFLLKTKQNGNDCFADSAKLQDDELKVAWLQFLEELPRNGIDFKMRKIHHL
ncbi:hypothetical protein TNCT_135481, partial [Trichonephila clavata]